MSTKSPSWQVYDRCTSTGNGRPLLAACEVLMRSYIARHGLIGIPLQLLLDELASVIRAFVRPQSSSSTELRDWLDTLFLYCVDVLHDGRVRLYQHEQYLLGPEALKIRFRAALARCLVPDEKIWVRAAAEYAQNNPLAVAGNPCLATVLNVCLFLHLANDGGTFELPVTDEVATVLAMDASSLAAALVVAVDAEYVDIAFGPDPKTGAVRYRFRRSSLDQLLARLSDPRGDTDAA